MPKQLSTLSEFISEVFKEVTLSKSDAEAKAAIDKFWAPQVEEKQGVYLFKIRLANPFASDVPTSAQRTRAEYEKVVKTLRDELPVRKLISETTIIATPADSSHKTGAVATTHVMTAVQNGKPVIVTCVAALRIQWVAEDGHEEGGHREIISDASLLSISS
ncbi:hypothetical protein C8R47DRAFT_1083813 [Mycena vitilis]|nr:hypothetical protein C8R47DRAFT_1083813 [Mycena vitilis]